MPSSPAQSINPNENETNVKRKRRPAGTPDPEAEVVALSPATLLESDRYICDICARGFQRDQNLLMHRRRHKVPWKLQKRRPPSSAGEEEEEHRARKRVYVCPEASCLHNDRRHALGDLVGIKKHFRRKHSDRRQWVCLRCSKGYAVQSDYKAHLKKCGSRGHSCDCGRVFSRVENFIEHQDYCNGNRATAAYPQALETTSLSGPTAAPATSPSTSRNTNYHSTPPVTTTATSAAAAFFPAPTVSYHPQPGPDLVLQLLPGRPSMAAETLALPPAATAAADETALQLSIAPAEKEQMSKIRDDTHEEEELKVAVKEKASAGEARRRVKEELELVERQLADAEKVRRRAREELEKAYGMRAHAAEQVRLVLLQVTCGACRQQCQASPPAESDNVTTAGHCDE